MVKDDRINLRIEETIKSIWKDISEKLGYDDLTKFIIEQINGVIEKNNDLLDETDKEIIIQKQKKIQADKIRYLLKANRSEAFNLGRSIKIIDNYLKEGNFIDSKHLEKEINLQIGLAKLSDNPKRYLLNFLPHLKKKELTFCYDLVKQELINLGVSIKEISKVHFPKNSINSTIIKINNEVKRGEIK